MKRLWFVLLFALALASPALAQYSLAPSIGTLNVGMSIGTAMTGAAEACVPYIGSGVLACSANLVFDGTILSVGKFSFDTSAQDLLIMDHTGGDSINLDADNHMIRFYGSTGEDSLFLDAANHIIRISDAGSTALRIDGTNRTIDMYDGSGKDRLLLHAKDFYGLIVLSSDLVQSCTHQAQNFTCGDASHTATMNGDGTFTGNSITLSDFAKLTPAAAPPAACAAGTEGEVYSDTSHALCWCDGTTWTKIAGAGTCS